VGELRYDVCFLIVESIFSQMLGDAVRPTSLRRQCGFDDVRVPGTPRLANRRDVIHVDPELNHLRQKAGGRIQKAVGEQSSVKQNSVNDVTVFPPSPGF
jgi:hypothetical protein